MEINGCVSLSLTIDFKSHRNTFAPILWFDELRDRIHCSDVKKMECGMTEKNDHMEME